MKINSKDLLIFLFSISSFRYYNYIIIIVILLYYILVISYFMKFEDIENICIIYNKIFSF